MELLQPVPRLRICCLLHGASAVSEGGCAVSALALSLPAGAPALTLLTVSYGQSALGDESVCDGANHRQREHSADDRHVA